MKAEEKRKQAVLVGRRKRLSAERIKQAIAQHRQVLEELARADGATLGAKNTTTKQ